MADTVVSTQTSYPDRPDTSLEAYGQAYGLSRNNAVSRWWNSFFGSNPTYNQWRTEQLDKYNADLNAYNSYITSLVGQKAQAEEAGYNPAWLGSDPGGGSSPLQYENAQDPGQNPVGDMAQGIGTFMSLLTGIQNIKKMSLQNQLLGAEINNAALDNTIKGQEARYAGRYYGFRAFKLGFESDFKKLVYMNEINSRLAGTPFDGSYWREETAPGLGNFYEVSPDVRRGLSYQTQVNELDILKATRQWRQYQAEFSRWSSEEKKYYVENLQPIMKEYWEGRKTYQETVNGIYEAQKQNEMNNRTANTVTRVVLGFLSLAARFMGIPLDLTSLLVDPETGEVQKFK